MSQSNTVLLNVLLNKNLKIPSYQRPYEWDKSNVYILLDDIYISYKKKKNINLGTIILNKGNNYYDIVDGQQRLITLSLLLKVLDNSIDIKLLNEKIFCFSNTENKIINNYNAIKLFIDKLEKIENLNTKIFNEYIKKSINFYILETKDSDEAFQLFDGRNSKYKDLTPIDLLKAYHLGALPKNYPIDKKKKILTRWNTNIKSSFDIDNSTNKVEYLYNNILFNIYNWSLNKDTRPFTKKDIYLYKGFKKNDKYTYVKYYKRNNLYQINKPFKSGEDFFYMTNKYIKKFDNIIKDNNLQIKANITSHEYNNNLRFINYLYYGALFSFYDRFGENIPIFYKATIEEFIYKYSLLLRIKNKLISFQSLNYYVLNTKYNFFFECNNALKVDELLKLELENIGNRPKKDEKLGEMRNKLWKELM